MTLINPLPLPLSPLMHSLTTVMLGKKTLLLPLKNSYLSSEILLLSGWSTPISEKSLSPSKLQTETALSISLISSSCSFFAENSPQLKSSAYSSIF